MLRRNHTIQMTGDKLLPNMLLFVFPLIISYFCQRLFNAADTVIVGRFSGADAMAAVGATASVISFFNWGLIGFSVGADVAVAKRIGAKDDVGVSHAVHTAYIIAMLAGTVTLLLGEMFAVPILCAMATPQDILSRSVMYLRICFAGLFFNVIYNFGAAILRSGGDSRRPTLYMVSAGIVNVLLNLLFVCVFRLSVAGVAIATAFSQLLSAVLVTRTLMREQGPLKLALSKFRLNRRIACEIVSIGFPSMLQNMLFSLSNMVIQSGVNSFGTEVVAGNSAAATLEGFVYVGASSITHTCIAFTGQNNGAGNYKNIPRVLLRTMGLSCVFALLVGSFENIFGRSLLKLFASDPAVIASGLIRLKIVVQWLFLNGIADVLAASLRGIGYSLRPTIITLMGICGVRLIYVFTVFRQIGTLSSLYLCYPVSWIVTDAGLLVLWFILFRTFLRRHGISHL